MDIQKILDEQKRLAEETGLRKSDAIINKTIAARIRSTDPEWIENQKTKIREKMLDKDHIKKKSAGAIKKASDPEWIENQKKGKEQRVLNGWKEKQLDGISKRSDNSEWKKNVSEALRRTMQTSDWIEKNKATNAKKRKPISIDGIIYESRKASSIALNVSDVTISNWIKSKPNTCFYLSGEELEEYKKNN